MRRAVSTLLIVGAFLCATPAQALTVLRPDGSVETALQPFVAGSLVPSPPGTVVAVDRPCPNFNALACWVPADDTIYAGGAWVWNQAFEHEVGHVFDTRVLTDADRAAFARIVGRWDVEWFADAYSICATTTRPRHWFGGGYAPKVAQHRRVCALIRHAGAWYMVRASAWPALLR